MPDTDSNTNTDIVQAMFNAYRAQDHGTAEQLLSDDAVGVGRNQQRRSSHANR